MKKLLALTSVILATVLAGRSSAVLVFDDFNTSEGHFNLQPSFAGQSNVNTNSTADRVTTDSFEGAGNELLVLNLNTTNPARSRFLSGSGSPANNIAFTTTPGTDGFIGFYYKTSSPGLRLALNLDGDTAGDPGAAGATSEMDMSALTTVVADGQWHLMEWSLDATGWGASSGIGGGHAGGLLLDGTHYIDSIYIQNITASSTIAFDFVAMNSTSIADVFAAVPEASSMLAVGLIGIVCGGANWARNRRKAA